MVVAGCQYAFEGARAIDAPCPADVFRWADGVLAAVDWRPDEVFMMDFGETIDGLRLVELNSFSCSGLYACDLAKVVNAASRVAARAWERVHS